MNKLTASDRMQNKTAILQPEATYHIYNRANGQEKLFVSEENYRYFLQKYQEYISPIADTFCYCLMPNHFHFLVRIKTEVELKQAFPKFETLEKLSSKCFSNFFSAYTQAFNKRQGRMGSLFMKNFKRKRISEQSYLLNLILYIHRNPIEARLCKKPEQWPHSSYPAILSGNHHFLKASDVVSWFEDKDNFQYIHLKKSMFEPENL